MTMPTDQNGNVVPVISSYGPTQIVTSSATSKLSAAFGAGTRFVRLVNAQDCWVKFGAAPTAAADTTSIFLPKSIPEYFGVKPADKVAVIQDSTAGLLTILEG